MPKTETQVLCIPALSLVDIHIIKVFGRATNGLLSRSLLFHSFLSLFSHPNVRHFCFFQEEEDRKIIKKGLPFFFAFFVNCWGPSWRKRDRFIKCFLSILPTINSCFPLVKSMYGQKKSSQTCGNFKCHLPAVHFLNWSDYSCLTFQKQANANLLIGHQFRVKIICSHNGWTLFSA